MLHSLAPVGVKILLVLTLLAANAASAAAAARPNILWILGDDLGCELACYGEPGARTPHLDRLAAEGMRCNCFYTTAPVCSASRSAWLLAGGRGDFAATPFLKPL